MAITTQFLTGFEHGFVGTAAAAGGGLLSSLNGSVTAMSASTSSPRNGNYCLRVVAPANTTAFLQTPALTTVSKMVYRLGIKVSARPSSGVATLISMQTAQVIGIQISSAGVLSAVYDTGVSVTGPTIDTTNWHLIEFQVDGLAKTLDWKVDGVLQTRATYGGATSYLFGGLALGPLFATQAAFTAEYDDVIMGAWTVASTDWYGDGKVIAQRPASDGSHNVATSFSPGDAGTAYGPSAGVTTAYTMVDDAPGTGGWTATRSATDNLAMRVASGGAWLEVAPAPSTESVVANAVRAIMSYSSPATQANLAACEVRNSAGVTTELWGLIAAVGKAYNIVANQFKGALVTTPAAGWTAAEVNAVRLRFGGPLSVDISPVPTVQAMMLEVDWPLVQGTTYNDIGSGTIVASGSGTEDYSHDASISGIITASGSGVESYSTPVIYTDSTSGTITASGISTDNRIYDDNASGTSTFSGTGVDNCIATDVAVGTITSSGIGTDNRIYDNSASGTITASGSSIESYFNVDSGSGIVTASGSGVESYNYTDSSSGTVTASGSGVESWTTPTAYDLVIDIDNPTSHWKLGNSSIAVDRKGVRNLPAIGGPISVVNGILANNGSDQANQFVGTVGQSFSAGSGTGLGTPYEGAFSIEAWVTPTADADGVVVKRTVSTDLGFVNSGLGVSVTAEFTFENSANVSFTIFTPLALALKVNQTYHVVGTYDGITAILYINGVEIRRTTSVGVGGVRSSTTLPPLIGSTSANNWPKAVVDEIAWYSGALSPARVIAHYQAGNTGIANFDSGVGTVTVSGSGVRSASYTDSRFGTITSSGSGVESSIQNGSGSVIATVTGSGIESYVSAYATLILADSPAGYWHLNDLTDSSGHGLTLTQTGTVTDIAGLVIGESGAKQFHTDFQNDGLRRADEALVRNGSAFTVEAWVKPADVGGVAFYAVQKDHQYHLQMLPSGAFRLRVFTSSGFFEADSVVIAVAGTTYHVVGVVEDEIVKIYVNGVLEGTASCPGVASVNTNAFAIGSDPGINQGWWGVVDEVAIYQAVLSPIRIQEHYAVGSGITAVTNNDSGSGTVTASGTGTDALVYSDSSSGTVTASGTGIDSRVYSDTATITISVTGTGIDASAYNDTSTGTIVVSGTGADARVYPDTGTGTITGTGTGTDSSVYADAGIGTIAVSGTDIEAYVYTDTGIGTIIGTGAGTESVSYTASAIGTATVNGTSAETASHSASATGAIVISGTGIDNEIYNDARSGTVLISGTGVDSSDILITYIDARSGQITVSGTSIESQSHSSTATGSLSAVGTSIESQSHSSTAIGTVFVDGTSIESQSYSNTATGTVSVNGTSIESQSHTSTAIGTVSISGTSVESQSHSSTAIGSASVNGTSTESQSHTNTATGFVFVDGAGSETYDISSTDTSVGIITSTGTGVESISYTNTAIGTITSTGTSIDTVFYSNTADGTITLLGSGGESSSYTDASTGVIVLIGTGREIGAHTQPIPFSTIIALNRFTVTIRNQASIQSVITNTTPLSVQIALQRSIKVDVAKRNGTKVLVKSR